MNFDLNPDSARGWKTSSFGAFAGVAGFLAQAVFTLSDWRAQCVALVMLGLLGASYPFARARVVSPPVMAAAPQPASTINITNPVTEKATP